MAQVATFPATAHDGAPLEITVQEYDGKLYADCDALGMGHKFDAERYTARAVASELARRHGAVLAVAPFETVLVRGTKSARHFYDASAERQLARAEALADLHRCGFYTEEIGGAIVVDASAYYTKNARRGAASDYA